ncbi:efflux RND transporter permease subunit [Mucilaginibacter angelicae]|uniref:Efflux RND transporter permease subunit n=1 Tax=Mucilaginibacter angelicae TaxID=869718 RepID=A0ABV6L0V9_9SPHI
MTRPFRSLFSLLILSILSLLFIPYININLEPHSNNAELFVNYNVQNANPEQTEQYATSVIENVLSQLTNLKLLNSTSGYGYGQIQLIFDNKVDISEKRLEVQSLIRRVKSALHSSVSYPTVSSGSANKIFDQSPLLIYSLSGDNLHDIDRKGLRENLLKKIEAVKGIKQVFFLEKPAEEVSILYNDEKLKQYQLSAFDIASDIKSVLDPVFLGTTTKNQTDFFLKINPSKFEDLSALQRFPLRKIGDKIIELGDVASISWENTKTTDFFRINGRNASNILIYADKSQNVLFLTRQIKAIIEQEKKVYKDAYRIDLEYDGSALLQSALYKVYEKLGIALIILLAFVLISYRNIRKVLILILSVSVNIGIVVFFISIFKFEISLFSIPGITIAFGIVVTHAIVTIDYFGKYKNSKFFPALVAGCITIGISTLLLFILPEDQRQSLKDFSVIVLLSMTCSLFTNSIFNIALFKFLFPEGTYNVNLQHKKLRRLMMVKRRYTDLIFYLANHRKLYIVIIVLLFGIPTFMLPRQIEGNDIYNSTIGSNLYNESLRPILDPLLGGSLRLFYESLAKDSFNSDMSETKLLVMCDTGVGSNINDMNSILAIMEDYLKKVPGVEKFVTKINSNRNGFIEISFKKNLLNGPLPEKIKSTLTQIANQLGGVDWEIVGVGRGFSTSMSETGSKFTVIFKGYNYDNLNKYVDTFTSALSKQRRVKNITLNGKFKKMGIEDLTLHFDNKQLLHKGTDAREVFSGIRQMAGNEIKLYPATINNSFNTLVIKDDSAYHYGKWELLNGNLHLSGQKYVRLENSIKLVKHSSSSLIYKENREYVKAIEFNFLGSERLGEEFLNEVINASSKNLPMGYSITREGYSNVNFDSFSQYYYLVIFFVLITYIICVVFFEMIIEPLLIVLVLPVSFIGPFLIFFGFDIPYNNGIYASAIFIIVFAINSCLYIKYDYFVMRKSKNKFINDNKALIKANFVRSQTVVLIMITSICSLMPFLLDKATDPFWFSFAVASISGLACCFFPLFFILPVLSWKLK